MPTPAKKLRCQSCGQPLGMLQNLDGKAKSNFGTNTQGKEIHEYCDFCFKDGAFVEPKLTMDQMTARTIKNMERELGISEEQAQVMVGALIPQLKRWR